MEQKQIAAISTPVKILFCPARRAPNTLPATGSWYGPSGNYGHAQTDYAGSEGNGNNGAIVYLPAPPGNNTMITLTGISDGTSNTILIGEKAIDRQYIGQYQGDDNEGYTSGWDHDVIRRTDRAPWQDAPRGGWGEQRFGGPHSSGFLAALCDGSVRTISFSIDLITLQRAGQRNDGQVLGSDW